MKLLNKAPFLVTICYFSLISLSPSAWAQEATTDEVESDGTIIITARKREESLQEFAGAATVISGEDFANNLITNTSDLRDLVPNLYLELGLGSSTPKIFIRGIGIDNPDVSFDSPVGFYVDGVYHARAFGVLADLYDIDQVEFLRGPQGTLYGRNNSAGALRIITRKPELDKYDGGFSLGFGTESQINANLFVNVPLQEGNSALRFSLTSRQNDGFMTELNSGATGFQDDNLSGRISALFKLNEQWQLVARADFLDETGGVLMVMPMVLH